MSDIGTETVTSVLKISGKTIEALMKLLKFLIDRDERRTNRSIKREQLTDLKMRNRERKKEEFLSQSGHVKAKQLYASGEKLRPLSVKLSEEQLKRFDKYANIYGVLYTSISDGKNKEQIKAIKEKLQELQEKAVKEGLTKEDVMDKVSLSEQLKTLEKEAKDRIVIIREKDLLLIKDITDRMNEDIKLQDVSHEMEHIASQPVQVPTGEDASRLEQLKAEKETILSSGTTEFNRENAEIIFDDISNDMQKSSLSFDKALNRFTDRDFSRDMPYYACERTNPTSYIEMTSTLDTFNDKEYTKTDYHVFNNGAEQLADTAIRKDGRFTDERFSGRPRDFWQSLKNDIKIKGGFSDDLVIFNNRAELESYQEIYKKSIEKVSTNEYSINIDSSNEYKDCIGLINDLKKQLQEHDVELSESYSLCKRGTNEILCTNPNMTVKERIEFAECTNIARQIEVLDKLNKVQIELAMVRQQQEINDENFNKITNPSIAVAEVYNKTEEDLYSRAYSLEQQKAALDTRHSILSHEREQIISIGIVDSLNPETDKEISPDKSEVLATEDIQELNNSDAQSMAVWKEQISQERQSLKNNKSEGMELQNPISSKENR